MHTQLGPISIDLKDGWVETTHDLEGEDPPITLERQAGSGCGAFQFSIGLYKGGRLPFVTVDDLTEMLLEFAEGHELGEATDTHSEIQPLPLAAATFHTTGDMVRVWYVSDGASVVKATYLAAITDNYGSELADCEQMIRAMSFNYAERAN